MRAQITFSAVVQDIQDYNIADPDEDQMVSRILFSLELDGSRLGAFVEVAQPTGTDYKTEPLTVGPLSQEVMGGPWNHEAFTAVVEDYYRSALEKSVRLGEAGGVHMQSDKIIHVKSYEFDIETGWSPPP